MACDGRDRAAAHAAVRNLAEVYGIDLLPLELKKELITPPKQQGSYCSITRRLSEPANVSDHEAVSTPVNGRNVPSFPLLGQLDEDCSTVGSSPATATSASTSRPPSATDFAGQTPCDVLQQMVADGSVACTGGRPQAISAASAARWHAESPSAGQGDTAGPGAERLATTHVVSEDREVDRIAVDELLLSEAEYIEYQMPLEQRITLLEEERDTLVDKLLSTTEALHTLEARNRESQATASQVSALLDQLQELLRRAEAERDRAKMQLRRQRLSASQVRCEATDITAPAAAEAAGVTCSIAGVNEIASGAAGAGLQAAGEGSTHSSSVLQGADDGDAFLFQREFKRHKSSNGGSGDGNAVIEPSCASALGAANSSSVINCGAAEAMPEAAEDFTPSSNEARPPVKTAIHGFEKLMKQQNFGPTASGRNSGSGSGSGSSGGGTGLGTASSAHKLLRASFEAAAAAAATNTLPADCPGSHLVSNAAQLGHLKTCATPGGSASATPAAGTPTSYAAVAASNAVGGSRMRSSSSSSSSPRSNPPPLSPGCQSPRSPAGKGVAPGLSTHKHSWPASRASLLGPSKAQVTHSVAAGTCQCDSTKRGRPSSPVAGAHSQVVGDVAHGGGCHSNTATTASNAATVPSAAAPPAVEPADGSAGQQQPQPETQRGVDVYDPAQFAVAAAAATSAAPQLVLATGPPAGRVHEQIPAAPLASADSAADGDVEVHAEVLAAGVEQGPLLGHKQDGPMAIGPRGTDDSGKQHAGGVNKVLTVAVSAVATAQQTASAGKTVHASTSMSSAGTAPAVPASAPAPVPVCSRSWPQSWFALAVLALLLLAGASMSVLHGSSSSSSSKQVQQLQQTPAEAGSNVASVQALQAELAAMQQKVVQLEQQLMDQSACASPGAAGRGGGTDKNEL